MGSIHDGKYVLRPASPDEAGLFYALPPERDPDIELPDHNAGQQQGMTMGGMSQ